MKTRQSTGYFKRVYVRSLLCFISSVVFAGSAVAFSGNLINMCSDCHGTSGTAINPGAVDYRPNDSAYRNISTSGFTGNHRTHMTSAITTTSQALIACAPCHAPVPTVMDHRNGVINMRQHINSSASSTARGFYNKPVGNPQVFFNQTSVPQLSTCNNVNCHFRKTTTAWGSTPIAASQNDVSCAYCHNSSGATPMATGNHIKHLTAFGNTITTCVNCHPNNTTFTHATSVKAGRSITVGFAGAPKALGTYTPGGAPRHADYPNYLDNTGNYGTCTTTYCHGAGNPVWNAAPLQCNSCHDATNAGGLSPGHAKHYNSAAAATLLAGGADAPTATNYVYACLNCHPTNQHATGPVTVVSPFQDAAVVGTKVTAYVAGGTSSLDTKSFNYTNGGTCTSVCHTSDGIAGAAKVAQNWGTAPTGTCGVCHNKAGDAAPTWSTPHTKHINGYAANTNITCNSCHAATATNNTTINGVAGRNQHPNANKDVAMGAFPGGTVSGVQGAQQCANTYCHSNGTAASGTHAAISWSGAFSTCAECHGNAASLATVAHNKHIGALATVGRTVGCADCHSATASSNTVIGNVANHVDKNLNIKFDNVINKDTDSPSYNAVATTTANGATKAAGAVGYNCANVYCHSSGNVNNAGVAVVPTTFRTIAWNAAALGCDGCHGDQAGKAHPVYASGAIASATANSHVKHVESSSLSCDYCHNTTTTDTTIPPTTVTTTGIHLNRTDDVSFKSVGGKTGTYAAAGKTCSTTYCHGTGPSVGWGGATNCASCHSASNALPGGHVNHIETASLASSYKNMSGNVSSATQYRFSCAACHSSAKGAIHANGPSVAGGANGPAEIFFGFTSANRKGGYAYGGAVAGTDPIGGINYTSGSCSATYCHSDGNGGNPKVSAFNWTSANNTLRCYGCHGSQDIKNGTAQSVANYSSIRTQAHARHVRPDINTELGYGNGLTCNRCHGATVSAALNSYSTVGAGVLNKIKHVNKLRDYSGVTANPNGGAAVSSGQLNATNHNCSNVYCHSNSKVGTTVEQYASPDAWNSGTTNKKCNYCHGRQTVADASMSLYSSTGAPNYVNTGAAGGNTANSHSQHVNALGTTDYSNTNVCYTCHSATLDSTTGRSASAAKFRAYSSRHVSGSYNIKMKSSIGGVYNGTIGAKTCATSTCHGAASPKWGANTANYSCTKCHGKPTTFATFSTSTYEQAAPGYAGVGVNTGGVVGTIVNGVSADAKVGAHDAHLRDLGGYKANGILCADCHAPVSLSSGFAGHMNGASTMTWSNLAQNIGTTPYNADKGAIVPSYAAGTCSTNYCHGGAFAAAVQGTGISPTWTNSAYLSNPASTMNSVDCNRCHQSPPFSSVKFNHTGVTLAVGQCSGCHNHDGGNDPRHINGTLEAAGGACNSCHDYDVVGSTYSAGHWSGGTWGKNSKDGLPINEGWGAHAKHINFVKNRLGIAIALNTGSAFGVGEPANVCGTCHTNLAANHTTGGSTTGRLINFGDSTFKIGGATGQSILFGASNPLYNGSSGVSSATTPKTCSNLSCHYFTTPLWSTY